MSYKKHLPLKRLKWSHLTEILWPHAQSEMMVCFDLSLHSKNIVKCKSLHNCNLSRSSQEHRAFSGSRTIMSFRDRLGRKFLVSLECPELRTQFLQRLFDLDVFKMLNLSCIAEEIYKRKTSFSSYLISDKPNTRKSLILY